MSTESLTAVTVQPARRIRGRLTVPGDKSISHRYVILAALAEGSTRIRGYAPGADCASTLQCLERLGVEVGREETPGRAELTIAGRGLRGLRAATGELDAGNSGTTMRLLAGVLAAHAFRSELVGDASLQRRPMRRVIEPLERMGARIESRDGRPPLRIDGQRLHGIDYDSPVASAQVKSCVLLAGLQAEGRTSVREPAPTRDHTERALRAFGVALDLTGGRVGLQGGQPLHARSVDVPGDLSSAVFWAVAAAALDGSEVEITEVGLNPTRTAVLDVLRRAGADVEVAPASEAAHEPRGTIRIRAAGRRPLTIGPGEVPGLIDELPALAALATHGGGLEVSGAGELRAKESDRIATVVAGIRALGGTAEERADGFVVRGETRLRGGEADAAGDHRLAMALAIAALGAERPSVIRGAEAVAVSYPGFFEILDSLRQ